MAVGYSLRFYPLRNDLRSNEQTKKDLEFLKDPAKREKFINNVNLYVNNSANTHDQISVKNCSDKDFGGNLDAYDMEWVNSSTCFDTDDFPLNMYKKIGDPRGRYPVISFQSCENNTQFRKFANDCISLEEQHYFIANYEIRTYYIYSSVAYNLTNAYNPIKIYLENFYTKFFIYSGSLNKRVINFVDVRRFIVNTDVGYFTPNIIVKDVQELNSNQYLIGGNPYAIGYLDNSWRRIYSEVIFYSSKTNLINNRTYPKVQDIIANAGGIMGLVAFAIQNFVQMIYDSRTKELLIHQLFYLNENDIELSNQNVIKNNKLEINKKNNIEANKAYSFDNPNNLNMKQGGETNVNQEMGNLNNSSSLRINVSNLEKENPPSDDLVPNSKYMSKKKMSSIRKLNNNNQNNQLEESKQSTARMNILESTSKNEEITKIKYTPLLEERVPLSMFDHFLLSYFCCCICGRLKKISNYYSEVEEIVSGYTDILNIVQNAFEMEKLKYLLMDEDQVAIFNLRSKLSFERESTNQSEFSKYYYFCKDLNDSVNVEQIKSELKERPNQIRFNKRLIDLDKELQY